MNNKDNDTLQRFIFESTDIRGEITTLSASYLDLLALQKYPPQVELLFGEFLAAASLLSSSLKHRGMITVQANGSGPITAIMAECSQDNKLRGIVRGDFDNLGDLSTLQELLGKATLAITLEPEGRERYQGVVPLDEDNLSKCLEFYFYQSEQLPTKIKLASNSEIASGLFIQQLPPSSGDREESLEDWQRVSIRRLSCTTSWQISDLVLLKQARLPQKVRTVILNHAFFVCQKMVL